MNGAELKSLRIERGLSQQELADLSGIPAGTIGRLESTGGDIKKIQTIEALSNVFKNEGFGVKNNRIAEPEYSVTKVIEPENTITALQRYISPDHTPIPVYDNTDRLVNISELMNTGVKPVVLLMKGHLGCDMIVRHNDAAMDNDFLKDGVTSCQLGIQQVTNFKNRIIPGMAAIIELEEYTITRYVHNGDSPAEFLLKSADAELYPDMHVNVSEIKRMWKIKSVTPLMVSKILMY